jgi:hypothetical protein
VLVRSFETIATHVRDGHSTARGPYFANFSDSVEQFNLWNGGTKMLLAEKVMEHIGKTKGSADHDHDLVHGLSSRLDELWRCDQFINNAEGHPEVQEFWREVKQSDEKFVNRLKELIKKEIEAGCF